jgi:hypothetical protein
MIVRTLEEAEMVTLFGSFNARLLVNSSDRVGHILIDTKISAGKFKTIEHEYLSLYGTQAHYCIDGEGIGSINGINYHIRSGTLIATSLQNYISIKSETNMHIASIFCLNSNTSVTIVRNIEAIYSTERDVFWGNGRSRRLLIRKDGMGFALCITLGYSGTDSFIQYHNHFESCYYISGTGEYEWESGKHPINTSKGQSTVFIMDQHDKHYMRVKEESICLSIFTPPIEGYECHDFSNGDASFY